MAYCDSLLSASYCGCWHVLVPAFSLLACLFNVGCPYYCVVIRLIPFGSLFGVAACYVYSIILPFPL